MRTLIRDHATPVWLGLLLVTALSWWLGADHEVGLIDKQTATLAVIAVAFIKVRFVGMYFMELRHAPLPLQLIFQAWCVIVCAAVLGIYLVGD